MIVAAVAKFEQIPMAIESGQFDGAIRFQMQKRDGR
jgi:hypothetical protein